MHLVLCHPEDHAARRLHGALRAAGLADLHLVSVEQLVYGRVRHRMDCAGDAGEIRLADGRLIRPERVAGLVNRLRYLPTAHFEAAAPGDRLYAADELHAFMLAWLDAVPGVVVNRALPGALDGGSFPEILVMQHAAAAGLPVAGFSAGSRVHAQPRAIAATHSVIVFRHRVFGPVVPRPLQDACRRLAVSLGVALLQIGFARSPHGEWRFAGATGWVDFDRGGQALAGALAGAFRERAA